MAANALAPSITRPPAGIIFTRQYKQVLVFHKDENNYRKISNISSTKSQNLTDSCLVLQLSSHNPLKPGVKSRMKM